MNVIDSAVVPNHTVSARQSVMSAYRVLPMQVDLPLCVPNPLLAEEAGRQNHAVKERQKFVEFVDTNTKPRFDVCKWNSDAIKINRKVLVSKAQEHGKKKGKKGSNSRAEHSLPCL